MFDTNEMPLYASHKRVRALEIKSCTEIPGSIARDLVFADETFSPTARPGSLFARYVPVPGDFYVVYEDGYESFSPRKAFLEGYRLHEDSR